MRYNGINSFLYVNAIKIYKFKEKESEVKVYLFYLVNISKYFTIDNMEKARLKEYVHVFSVDNNGIDTSNILSIHNI